MHVCRLKGREREFEFLIIGSNSFIYVCVIYSNGVLEYIGSCFWDIQVIECSCCRTFSLLCTEGIVLSCTEMHCVIYEINTDRHVAFVFIDDCSMHRCISECSGEHVRFRHKRPRQ